MTPRGRRRARLIARARASSVVQRRRTGAARRWPAALTSSTGAVASMPTSTGARRRRSRAGAVDGRRRRAGPRSSRPCRRRAGRLAAVEVGGRGRRGGSKSTCQMWLQVRHVRRPDRRRTTSSSSTTSQHDVELGVGLLRGACRRAPRPAAPCAGSRRAGTRRVASGSRSRLRTMSMVTSSGTRSPRSMNALACRPSGVPWLTLARKMSPVLICGTRRCSAMYWAWVPLPAPGGPTRTRRTRRTPCDSPRTSAGGSLRSCAASARLSTCFTVSSPTPTMIRIAVPPNGTVWPLPVGRTAGRAARRRGRGRRRRRR